MEITKDVIFDTNLFQNETVKLTYTGYLFKANSTDVSIVYGYGDNWENTTEQPMQRTLNGFITNIEIQNFDKINFCFKNSYEEWDNNNYQDYHASILPPVTTTETEESDYSNIQEIVEPQKSTLLDEILGEYTLYFDNREEFNFNKFIQNIVSEIVETSSIEPSFAEDIVVENTVVNDEISDFVNFELEEQNTTSSTSESETQITSQETIVDNTTINEEENHESQNNVQNILKDIYNIDEFDFEESLFDIQTKPTLDNISGIEKIEEIQEIENSNTLEFDNTDDSTTENADNNNTNNIINNNDAILEEVTNEVTQEAIEDNNSVLLDTLSDNIIEDLKSCVNYIQAEIDSLYIEDLNDIKEIDNSLNKFLADDTDIEENLIEQATTIDEEENDIYVPVKEEASLVDYESNKFVLAARKLTPFYKFQKRVKLFFYKAFNSIKLFSRDYTQENNKQ